MNLRDAVLLLTALITTGVQANTHTAQIQPKIINGTAASETQFPWQVGLSRDRQNIYFNQFCSGSIIDARWILTAAHCVNDAPNNLHVVAGVSNLFDEDDAQVIAVEEILLHPQFTTVAGTAALEHDIALLRLRTPIDFIHCGQRCTTIDWLDTPSEAASIQRGTAALINGWGRTVDCQTNPERCAELRSSSAGSLTLSPAQLQWATVNVDGCLSGSSLHDATQISVNMLCASEPRVGADSCQGDSGGGLTVTAADGRGQVLAGITSWGRGCAQAGFPAVYTRVARYDQWINNRLAGRPSSADRTISSVDNSAFWRDLNPPREFSTIQTSSSGGGSFGLWGFGLLAGLAVLRRFRSRTH